MLFSLDEDMRPGSVTILGTPLGPHKRSPLRDCQGMCRMEEVAAGSWDEMLKTEYCEISETGRVTGQQTIREPWAWTGHQILVVPVAPTQLDQMQPEDVGGLTYSHVSIAPGRPLEWVLLRPQIGPRSTSAEQYAHLKYAHQHKPG